MVTSEAQNADEDLSKKHPKILCLFLDGLGVAADSEFNAVTKAKLMHLKKYVRDFPVTLLAGTTKDENRRYWSLGTGLEDNSDIFPQALSSVVEIISQHNLKQLKICASEQALSLNLFFNNYKGSPYLEEKRVCINTPSEEDTLNDLAKDLSRLIRDNYQSGKYDVIYASLPLAHEAAWRGDFKKAIKALEALDKLLAKIINPIINAGDLVLLLSPYGNIERTRDILGDWDDKEATHNPVPFLLLGAEYEGKTIGLADPLDGDLSILAPGGTLADFAPTLLSLLNIDKPMFMTGESLI